MRSHPTTRRTETGIDAHRQRQRTTTALTAVGGHAPIVPDCNGYKAATCDNRQATKDWTSRAVEVFGAFTQVNPDVGDP
jgi:hypothetical protein